MKQYQVFFTWLSSYGTRVRESSVFLFAHTAAEAAEIVAKKRPALIEITGVK